MKFSLREAINRLRSFFHKEPLDRQLNDEMDSHLEFAIDENIARGMTPQEARRQALVRFGGVQQAREQQREARGLPWLDVLMQDLRYTLRTLRRDRGFAIVAILILALGIGANVAVFSVVNTILLRPLPFSDPQRLVWIQGPPKACGLSCETYSADAFEDYQRQNRTMESVTAYFPFLGATGFRLTGRGEPQPVAGVPVAGNFFETLGVQPYLGRLFTPDELVKNGRPAALLSYYFWKRQFAGDRSIVGQTITLNNSPVLVAGVMPASFDFGSVFVPGAKIDIFVPAVMDNIRDWGNTLLIVGRMKPGVTVGQAATEANSLFPQFYFEKAHPDYGKGYKAQLESLKEHVSGKLRRSLEVLWCAVGLILLIVCVNLSNLLLARAASRGKEFAMRTALGAARGRLIRQLLTESLVLSGAGAALGLALAYGVVAWLAHQGSVALPLLSEVRVDWSALGWTLLIAAVAAMAFGLTPGLRFSKVDLQDALKDGGYGTSAGRRHDRMRAALVISEVALACVLVVGAGLLLRSFLRVMDIDLGFQPDRAAAISVDYDDGNNATRRGVILEQMIERVKAIPGIEEAGISDMLPLDSNRSWAFQAKGTTCSPLDGCPNALVQMITPGYIAAMGMHLREGRDLAWSDGATSQKVVIMGESAAKLLWPGQDPMGRIAVINGVDTQVIGVVSDVRDTGVEDSAGSEIYLPVTQAGPVGAELVVRTTLPPDVLAKSVMSVLRQLNPAQPAAEFRPIATLVGHAVSPRKFFALLVSIFAEFGLVLATLGIYGVISYLVTQQTQEIGIRMALGATQGRVLRGVLGKTMQLAVAGIALGTVASFVVAKWIATLLFGTKPTDPVTFAAMVVIMTGVAFIAGYIPAWRASRVDPMVALRAN